MIYQIWSYSTFLILTSCVESVNRIPPIYVLGGDLARFGRTVGSVLSLEVDPVWVAIMPLYEPRTKDGHQCEY